MYAIIAPESGTRRGSPGKEHTPFSYDATEKFLSVCAHGLETAECDGCPDVGSV